MATKGIILFFIILVPSIAIVSCRKWLIKLDTKHWYILLVFAIFCFLYFFIGRYILDAINYDYFMSFGSKYSRDIYFSKVLLLDLCPFMAFLLPLITIFDKKRIISRLLAPVTIIGSLITLFGQCIWIENKDLVNYIFLGDNMNRLYFIMHFLSLLLALWILMVSKTYTYKTCIYCFLALLIWFIYTISMKFIFDVQWNVTGLSENDWISSWGQYNVMYKFWQLPFPWIVIFWYSIALIINYLIILAIPNNFVSFKKFCLKKQSFSQKSVNGKRKYDSN